MIILIEKTRSGSDHIDTKFTVKSDLSLVEGPHSDTNFNTHILKSKPYYYERDAIELNIYILLDFKRFLKLIKSRNLKIRSIQIVLFN